MEMDSAAYDDQMLASYHPANATQQFKVVTLTDPIEHYNFSTKMQAVKSLVYSIDQNSLQMNLLAQTVYMLGTFVSFLIWLMWFYLCIKLCIRKRVQVYHINENEEEVSQAPAVAVVDKT
jgi:hypothetical protein